MKRPTLFWSLVVAVLIAGVLAYVQMPKLEDPVVAVKQAMVVVPWPGADAHEVELEVAVPMEDALRALPDVKKVTTECHDGSAMLTVEFLMTVPLSELEQHFDLLRRKVNDMRAKLPQGCYDPVVVDDMMDVYGIFYALTGDGYTYPELDKYARLIRRELLGVKGSEARQHRGQPRRGGEHHPFAGESGCQRLAAHANHDGVAGRDGNGERRDGPQRRRPHQVGSDGEGRGRGRHQ